MKYKTKPNKTQEEKSTEEYMIEIEAKDEKDKRLSGKINNYLTGKYFIPIVIILIASIAFSLGRISGLQEKRPAVRVISGSSSNTLPNPPYIKEGTGPNSTVSQNSAAVSASSETSSGQVVGSKNSTKYHYPWCAGAKQISAKNLITFDSIEAARAAGYTPASNCKGLK